MSGASVYVQYTTPQALSSLMSDSIVFLSDAADIAPIVLSQQPVGQRSCGGNLIWLSKHQKKIEQPHEDPAQKAVCNRHASMRREWCVVVS